MYDNNTLDVKFIYLDAGDVLVQRRTKDGDNIAKELGFAPEKYEEVLNAVIAKQTDEQKAAFNHIRTLQDEYDVINAFHKSMCEYLNHPYDDALITKLSEYRIKADFELKDGVVEGLQRLSQKFRLGVLSNALPSRRHFELKINNIDQYFETIILSWEEGINKPQEEIYKIALERINLKPENILFVDNKVKYLEGAKRAGLSNLVLMKVKEISEDYPAVKSLIDLADFLNV